MSDTIDWKRPQPLPKAVKSVLRANFPLIAKVGIYNDRNVEGTTKKSAHAEGRAMDIYLDVAEPNERLVGDRLFDILIDSAVQSGIDNVIWNRQIWSTTHTHKRPYTGKRPHTDHIHVEFTRPGSQLITFELLKVRLAELRTGLEELAQSTGNQG